MIIELPGTLGRESAKRFKMGFFHFSNNNLSIRKDCARDIGMYDPNAKKSEDVELCFRASLTTDWVACRDPGVIVQHKARRSLKGMITQMWGWGFHLGYAYSKTGRRGVYLYQVDSKKHDIRRQLEVEKGSWLVLGFFTDLHAFHALAIAAVIALALGAATAAGLLAVAGLGFLWRHAHYALGDPRLSALARLKLGGAYYLANLSFGTATFLGALRYKILLIPSAIFPTAAPE